MKTPVNKATVDTAGVNKATVDTAGENKATVDTAGETKLNRIMKAEINFVLRKKTLHNGHYCFI